MINNSVRPPRGIEPRYIWIETRLEHIEDAITRIFQENYTYPIPIVWIEEYNDLIQELKRIDTTFPLTIKEVVE